MSRPIHLVRGCREREREKEREREGERERERERCRGCRVCGSQLLNFHFKPNTRSISTNIFRPLDRYDKHIKYIYKYSYIYIYTSVLDISLLNISEHASRPASPRVCTTKPCNGHLKETRPGRWTSGGSVGAVVTRVSQSARVVFHDFFQQRSSLQHSPQCNR